MPEYYRVEQGDCISSIAFHHGFLPGTLWDHPENRELKELRKDHNILLKGDLVYIPDKVVTEYPRSTDALHKFRVVGWKEKLRIVILNEKGEPRQNIRYTLGVGGANVRGVTSSDGLIERSILPNADKARLILYEGGHEKIFHLSIGHLNPITEVSGVQMRLHNLDYYNGPIDGESSDKTVWAIEQFQTDFGFEPTGDLNDATRAKLEEVHGS